MQVAAFLLALTATFGSVMSPGEASAQTAPVGLVTTAPADPTDPPDATRGEEAAARIAVGRQDFTIVNNTGHIVKMLNVSPSSEETWGPDILGGDKLGNGEAAQINFDRGETQCKWDIRATYEDGDVTDMRDVNLCEVATVSLTP